MREVVANVLLVITPELTDSSIRAETMSVYLVHDYVLSIKHKRLAHSMNYTSPVIL